MKYAANILKLLVIPGVFCLAACENDIEKINSITTVNNFPEISGKKVEVLYSDSGKMKVQLNADEILQFAKAERPYIEFPKGIRVIFFDDSLRIESELFWDENLDRIYSNSFSRIERKDMVYYGQKGFETNQKFSPLRLKSSKATIQIKDEANPGKNP